MFTTRQLWYLRSLRPALLVLLVALAASCDASAETYRTESGNRWIKLISSSELEYRTGDTTFLCKYSTEQGSLRVIMSALGTQQVLYFRRTPAGFVSEEGVNFYSQAGMADYRRQQQAQEKMRQKANQERAARDAERQRIAEQGRQRTKVIGTFEAYTDHYGDHGYPSTELTDVDAFGKFDLGGIVEIVDDQLNGRAAPWGVKLQYHGRGENGWTSALVSFKDRNTRDSFVTALDTAILQWRQRFGSAAEVPYRGNKAPVRSAGERDAEANKRNADIDMLEGTDCSTEARSISVPKNEVREFTVDSKRQCWTPWVIGTPYCTYKLSGGDILVQVVFQNGKTKEQVDGPGKIFDLQSQLVDKMRFKSLQKEPVKVKFKAHY